MAVEIEIAGSFGGGSQVVCGSKYAESAGQARRAVADIGFVQRQPVALMNPEHIVGTPVDRRMPAEHVGAGGVAWLREAFVASGNRGRASARAFVAAQADDRNDGLTPVAARQFGAEDRKSTRLNPSH